MSMAVQVLAFNLSKENSLYAGEARVMEDEEFMSSNGQMSLSSSASTTLPFAHVMTPILLKELNVFERNIRPEFSTAFDTRKAEHATAHSYQHSPSSPERLGTMEVYTWQDVSIESVLGEGAFSVVFQVSLNRKNGSETKSLGTIDKSTPAMTRTTTKTHALKCLKAKAVESDEDLRYNAMDLITEAHILMHTDHPHIISMTGMSGYRLGDSYGMADGYFLVLEIMETTLMDTLKEWRKEVEFSKVKRRQLLSRDAMENRLVQIALPITSAAVYLHQHDVCLRDLKPENVGFDAHGNLKLFDFGLARLIHQLDEGEMAGSVCYMAPEVLLETGTCLKSDVYSLAMMIWELVTLELPMVQFQTLAQVQARVGKGHWRPPLTNVHIRPLRNVIKNGWCHKVSDRLSSKEMQAQLRQVCGRGDDDDVSDSIIEAPSIPSIPVMVETNGRPSFASGSPFSSLFRKKKC